MLFISALEYNCTIFICSKYKKLKIASYSLALTHVCDMYKCGVTYEASNLGVIRLRGVPRKQHLTEATSWRQELCLIILVPTDQNLLNIYPITFPLYCDNSQTQEGGVSERTQVKS